MLAATPGWSAVKIALNRESNSNEARAEDIFADGLTIIPAEMLTKAFVTLADGLIVGYAGYKRDKDGDGSLNQEARISLQVTPAFRRRGVGTSLLRRVEEEAAREGVRFLSCYPRLEFGAAPFALAHGWGEAYREVVQGADAARVPAPLVNIDRYFVHGTDCTAAMAEKLLATFQIACPQIAAWWSLENFFAALRKARPFNGVAVAYQDNDVVGFAWGLDAAPNAVFHEFTGVRPEWRGRGVASTLKYELAVAAVRAGRPRLITSNRVGNHAMFSINRRLGYQPIVEMALFQKELALSGDAPSLREG